MTLSAAYHSGVTKIYVPRFWVVLKSSIFDTVISGILLCTDNKGQFNNNHFYIINSIAIVHGLDFSSLYRLHQPVVYTQSFTQQITELNAQRSIKSV